MTRLFIILVTLTMSLFSEKILIFESGLMSNSIKKSWTVSNSHGFIISINDRSYCSPFDWNDLGSDPSKETYLEKKISERNKNDSFQLMQFKIWFHTQFCQQNRFEICLWKLKRSNYFTKISLLLTTFYRLKFGKYLVKVHIFWESHKIWKKIIVLSLDTFSLDQTLKRPSFLFSIT